MRPTPAAVRAIRFASLLLLIASHALAGQIPPRGGLPANLAGTTWQLVKFQGGDGTTLFPDVPSSYTISFGTDGRVGVRLDCNRGSGTWSSTGANQLSFGPLAVTRVACPPGSLSDRIARQWQNVRSYVVRNGHLYLSLVADGGIYEFEPVNAGTIGGGASLPRQITGTATYRERIALPRQAVFEATLEDVSRTRATSEIVARIRNEQPGNPPIPFTIAFDAGSILSNHTYTVRARIVVDNQVWFATDQNYLVLTGGRPSEVQLLLRRTSGQTLPGRVQSPPSLENTYWKLTQVGNALITPDARHPEANIELHPANGTVTGSGGCNRLTGRYAANGNRLIFSQIVSTMMACTSGMDIEQVFLKALGRVTNWSITGQNLDLFDSRGTLLARFEAGYLR